ncbi:MAG: Crp/Fnr family transcriptional regulator [Bdellovibrio bacteriovorus]
MTAHIRSGVLRRGTQIYAAGDQSNAVFTVRVGVVKLVMAIPGRESRIVRLLGRGATLGLEALAGKPYAHTAVAVRTTSLCRIPVPTVDELHVHNPQILHGLMAKWNEQVEWADRWITILGSGPVRQRLADLIRLIADISGDHLDAVHLPPVADIAAILGITPEAVSRNLAELKRDRLLTHVGPRTYQCDRALFETQDAR